MFPGRLNELVRHLNETSAPAGDAELLTRFVEARDGEAFAALVRRHGRMVLGVCRRALRDEHAAEDAFQATFLVLARRARDVRPRRLLANWLYGVAHRTALEARRAMATRRAKERRAAELAGRKAPSSDEAIDLRPLLDRELALLPERYRAPVVLCDLEGLTRREAARRLGWAEGTLSGRLFRARAVLARRLARYGLSVAGGALAAAFAEGAAGPPREALISSTVQAILAPAAAASAAALALTQGVMKTMLLTKLKAMTAGVLLLGLGLGAGAAGYRAAAGEEGGPGVEAKPPAAEAPARSQPVAERRSDADRDRLIAELEQARLREAILKDELAVLRKQQADLLATVADLRGIVRASEVADFYQRTGHPTAANSYLRPGRQAVADERPRDQIAPVTAPKVAPDNVKELADLRSRVAALEALVRRLTGAENASAHPPVTQTYPARSSIRSKESSNAPPAVLAERHRRARSDVQIQSYPVELLLTDGEVQPLISVITRMVAPDSWGDRGGDGAIVYFPRTKSLIVNQSPEVHAEVQELLVRLLKQAESQSPSGKTTAPAIRP